MRGWRVRQKSLLRVRKRHRRVVAGAQWSRTKVCRERAAFCLRLGRRDSADLLLLSRADRAVTARHSGFLFASARQVFLEARLHARAALGLREGSIMKVNYMLATAVV